MIKKHKKLSINRQCELLEVSKGALYYTPKPIDPYTLCLMDLIDRQHTKTPFHGKRRLVAYLKTLDYNVNRKHVRRLMELMRIEASYPKSLSAYMNFYNNERLHRSLKYGVPRAWYPKVCATVYL